MKFSDYFYISCTLRGPARVLLYVFYTFILLNTLWLLVMPFVLGSPLFVFITWPVAALITAFQIWQGSETRKEEEIMRKSFPNSFKD